MEYRRPYGADALFEFPLIDYGATSYESTGVNVSLTSAAGTIAAGDIVIFTDAMVATNPTAHYVKFSTGSTSEPVNGDIIQGNTSLCTATVMFSITTTGTWAGQNAAGYMFLKSVSSSFYTGSGNEVIHIASGGVSSAVSNIASFDTGSVAGLFGHSGRGMFAAAATATEMQAKQGWVQVMDQTGTKLWEDTTLTFVTTGHEDAFDSEGCILTDSTNTATGQTVTNLVMSNSLASLGVTPRAGNFVATYDATNGYQEGYVKSISGDDITLFPPGLQIGALPTGATVRIYREARVPSQVVALEANAITATAINADAITADKIADDAISTEHIAQGSYSGVTFGIDNIAAGAYSGVTIGGSSFVTINPGTYSNVTVQTENSSGGSSAAEIATAVWNAAVAGYTSAVSFGGALSRFSSSAESVGLKAVTHSAATVGVNNIAPAEYSGVTVGAGNIAPGAYSGVTVDIRPASLLSTNMGNSRLYQDAFHMTRNKVDASSSVVTFYLTDDTTSLFTASATTGSSGLVAMDPA